MGIALVSLLMTLYMHSPSKLFDRKIILKIYRLSVNNLLSLSIYGLGLGVYYYHVMYAISGVEVTAAGLEPTTT